MFRDDPDLAALLEAAQHSSSPGAALRALSALREELTRLERAHVERALDAGASFTEVAQALGISRQAAHRRYRRVGRPVTADIALDSPRTITREARAAIEFALDEAARRGSALVDSGHLLVGIVATADDMTAQRLRRLGVTPASVRRGPRAAPAARSRPGVGRSLRAALDDGGTLDLDRLLSATLDAPDGRALDLLEELSVAPRALVAALRRR